MTKQDAIDWAGGVMSLAACLKITGGAVSQWDEIPELQQHKLALLSRGKLKVDDKFLPLKESLK